MRTMLRTIHKYLGSTFAPLSILRAATDMRWHGAANPTMRCGAALHRSVRLRHMALFPHVLVPTATACGSIGLPSGDPPANAYTMPCTRSVPIASPARPGEAP